MPYITPGMRKYLEYVDSKHPSTPGELNYVLTQECLKYLGDSPLGMNYSRFNDIIGALEACKLEFYRRLVARYEDKKCHENGDVYPEVS